MPVKNLVAHLDCDGCGQPFTVDVDLATKVTFDEAIFEIVLDAVASEFTSSVQGTNCDIILCESCTSIVDGVSTDHRNASDEEVKKALKEAGL